MSNFCKCYKTYYIFFAASSTILHPGFIKLIFSITHLNINTFNDNPIYS